MYPYITKRRICYIKVTDRIQHSSVTTSFRTIHTN